MILQVRHPGPPLILGKACLTNELLHYPIPEQWVLSGRPSLPLSVTRERYQIA